MTAEKRIRKFEEEIVRDLLFQNIFYINKSVSLNPIEHFILD